MDDTRTVVFRWQAPYKKPWVFEEGAVTVCVLLPLTVLFSFVLPVVAFLLVPCVIYGIGCSGREWVRTWRSVVDVRVETGARRRLVLRQRYGRPRSYPLDAVTAVRPLQVGSVSRVMVDAGEDDEREETDEMALLLEVGKVSHTTYKAPHLSTATMWPLVEELRRACPHIVVAPTEYRMRYFVDVERGMSPG
ncbi:hypothetical protein G3I60_10755 [Streptomyces sp. SID13666]|uniref:hypothetical protein n=1 Tax=Streptomyces sp. SID13666 TaxID=2706054 RepID=UPI0013BFAA2C|nr:hypothetical protein [Streptomyces sp. SID13666]NEA54621.1 hypothetical protein [Streptomyces sp. SID13666]